MNATTNVLDERVMNWLHMAIDTDEETVRPVLSYGCIQEFRGKRIAVGCDSFHMHIVWLDDQQGGTNIVDENGNDLLLFEDSWKVLGGDYSSMKYPLVTEALEKVVDLPAFQVAPQELYEWADENASSWGLAVLVSPDVEGMKLDVLNGQPPNGMRSYPILGGTPKYGSVVVDSFFLMHGLHGFFHDPSVEVRIRNGVDMLAIGTPGKALSVIMCMNREHTPWKATS